MLESFRKEKVLVEVLFNQRGPGQIAGHASRKEAVAQPTGSLAGWTVHEYVQRVLPKCLHASLEELIQRSFTAGKRCRVWLRMFVFPKLDVGNVALSLNTNQLQEPKRVRFKRLHYIGPRFQIITDHIHATESFEVHVLAGKDLIENHPYSASCGTRHPGCRACL